MWRFKEGFEGTLEEIPNPSPRKIWSRALRLGVSGTIEHRPTSRLSEMTKTLAILFKSYVQNDVIFGMHNLKNIYIFYSSVGSVFHGYNSGDPIPTACNHLGPYLTIFTRIHKTEPTQTALTQRFRAVYEIQLNSAHPCTRLLHQIGWRYTQSLMLAIWSYTIQTWKI